MGGAYIAIHNHETRKEMQTNIITADALPLYKKELITELDSIITMEFNQGVRPWLTNYLSYLRLEEQCHSIQMSSKRMDS